MESNTNLKLDPEEEKFLDEVSAVFEPVREKYIIREAVQKKVAGSNFRFIDFTKPGGFLAWKYPLIITAIVGLTVGSWFVFKSADDKAGAGLQAATQSRDESLAKQAENVAAAKANSRQTTTGDSEILTEQQVNTNIDGNLKENAIADSKSGRTMQLLTKKQAFNRIEKSEKIEHKTSMALPANYNPAELKQKLSGILETLGLRPSDAVDTGNSVILKSQPVKGYYSKIDGKPVEFYIEFSLAPNNPAKLNIKLVFSYDKSAEDSRGRDYDMENIFYEKLKNELIKLFS